MILRRIYMESLDDFLDSEMSRCVDELAMLQAEYQPAILFKRVLDYFVWHLKQVEYGVSAEAKQYGVIVKIMYDAFLESSSVMGTMTAGSMRDWRKIVSEVNILKRTFSVLSRGAGSVDARLEIICNAILGGFSSIEETDLMKSLANADATMGTLLRNVGGRLKNLSDCDADFYGFLGPIAKYKMHDCILILTEYRVY
jgi:hypothetical protein